jgi:hypothetical protein
VALFRREGRSRRTQQAQTTAIAEFWAWWTTVGARLTTTALASGHPEQVEPEISRHVDAIDADLVWEIAPGERSRHELVVSGDGDPARRAIVRRWRMAAPQADGIWSYSDVRRPAADPSAVVLHFDDSQLDVTRACAMARVRGAALDVTVYHPNFTGMPEQDRNLATFLLLRTVLGEASVDTWLGSVGSTDVPPLDPVPLTGLRSVVAELHDRFTDADDGPSRIVLEGTAPNGSRVVATAQVPLRTATAPQLDTYVGVAVPFTDRAADGQAGELARKALDDLEETLAERLGGNGRLVAHETVNGVRVLHLYVDSTTDAADRVRMTAQEWEQGRTGLDVRPDPVWASVQHLAV